MYHTEKKDWDEESRYDLKLQGNEMHLYLIPSPKDALSLR